MYTHMFNFGMPPRYPVSGPRPSMPGMGAMPSMGAMPGMPGMGMLPGVARGRSGDAFLNGL